jgi:hypothetical protein
MTVKINRYQPTALENKIYSESRAARILNLKKSEIEFVVAINENECLVGLFNKSVRLSKSQFIGIMVSDRKSRSNYLDVTRNINNPWRFTVRNDSSESSYQLYADADHIKCECKDYQYLSEDFGTQKVACKHIFAVLGHLNFDSLKDYIKYNEEYYEDLRKNHEEREDYNLMAHA